MRAAVTKIAAATLSGAALLGMTPAAGAAPRAGTTPAPPSVTQIARALTRAESAPTLWATINVCHVARSGNLVGVRGEMPALGFTTTMAMIVSLQTWSPARHRFVAIPSPNATNHVALGPHATGLQQGGAEFPFRAGSIGQWRAVVTFSWTRAGRRLGQVTRPTTAGHPGADFASPPHYSAASCQIA